MATQGTSKKGAWGIGIKSPVFSTTDTRHYDKWARSGALLRDVERERFGTSESRVAEPCQFCLSPSGCGLENDPARPIACDLYPLFPTSSADVIAVHLWCPQAQAIAEKWIAEPHSRATIHEAVEALSQGLVFDEMLENPAVLTLKS